MLMAAPWRRRRSGFGESAGRAVRSRVAEVVAVAVAAAAETVILPPVAVLAGVSAAKWGRSK